MGWVCTPKSPFVTQNKRGLLTARRLIEINHYDPPPEKSLLNHFYASTCKSWLEILTKNIFGHEQKTFKLASLDQRTRNAILKAVIFNL